jgi:hypothetical protein
MAVVQRKDTPDRPRKCKEESSNRGRSYEHPSLKPKKQGKSIKHPSIMRIIRHSIIFPEINKAAATC